MEVDVRLDTRRLWRSLALLVLVGILAVAAFSNRDRIARLLFPEGDAAPTAMVKAAVKDFLDGRLMPDDPRVTARMASDLKRLAQLPHGQFIAFEKEPRVIAALPQDAPTWMRLVGSVRYRAPLGDAFLGEVTVEVVKEGDTWKVDRILVRHLAPVEP